MTDGSYCSHVGKSLHWHVNHHLFNAKVGIYPHSYVVIATIIHISHLFFIAVTLHHFKILRSIAMLYMCGCDCLLEYSVDLFACLE